MPLPHIFLAVFLGVARYACVKATRNLHDNCMQLG